MDGPNRSYLLNMQNLLQLLYNAKSTVQPYSEHQRRPPASTTAFTAA